MYAHGNRSWEALGVAIPTESERAELEERRARLRARHLRPAGQREPSNGAGIHHAALISSDVESTIEFSHFFFDLGNRTLLGFFDFPGLDLQSGVEAIGSVQHIAISVPRDKWERLRDRLDEAGVDYAGPDRGIEESMYFRDPNGVQIELLSDPLMYFGGRQLDE